MSDIAEFFKIINDGGRLLSASVVRVELFEWAEPDGRIFIWNVALAWERLGGCPQAERVIHSTRVAPLLDMIERGLITVDAEAAMGDDIDPSLPILVVPSPTAEDEHIVIDGWHRIYKAGRLGMTHVPMIMLKPEEERAIRVESRS